mgnify:FL=1
MNQNATLYISGVINHKCKLSQHCELFFPAPDIEKASLCVHKTYLHPRGIILFASARFIAENLSGQPLTFQLQEFHYAELFFTSPTLKGTVRVLWPPEENIINSDRFDDDYGRKLLPRLWIEKKKGCRQRKKENTIFLTGVSL